MSKSSKPIIILAIIVLLAVGGFSAISMYNYQNLPQVEVSESPFGISWGADKETVMDTMASQGYEIYQSNKENPYRITYILNNYQGVEGASGYAIFSFDEAFQFKDVMLQFTTFDSPNDSCSEDGVNLLYKSVRKTLKTQYEKMPYDFLEGYEYWKGDNIFTTLYYQKSESVIMLFTQHDKIAVDADEQEQGNQ